MPCTGLDGIRTDSPYKWNDISPCAFSARAWAHANEVQVLSECLYGCASRVRA